MDDQATKLIINYLPQNMTESELHSMFTTMGPLHSCRIMKDIKTGYSYGFGFVNYLNRDDAEKAIQQLNGLEIFNKRIKVSYSRPSGDNIKDTNLYVTNIPKSYSESDLDKLFSPYGIIVQKNLLRDKVTKISKGVGFIRYNHKDEALNAINNLNGTIPAGGDNPMSVRVAEEHGKMKAAYYAGWKDGLIQHSTKSFINPRGRRGPLSGFACERQRGGMIRGGRRNTNFIPFNNNSFNSNYFHNNAYNDNLVSYPIAPRANNGLGALRQDKYPKRFNPLAFNMPNSGYSR